VDETQLAADHGAEPCRLHQGWIGLPVRVDRDADPLERYAAATGLRVRDLDVGIGLTVTGHQ